MSPARTPSAYSERAAQFGRLPRASLSAPPSSILNCGPRGGPPQKSSRNFKFRAALESRGYSQGSGMLGAKISLIGINVRALRPTVFRWRVGCRLASQPRASGHGPSPLFTFSEEWRGIAQPSIEAWPSGAVCTGVLVATGKCFRPIFKLCQRPSLIFPTTNTEDRYPLSPRLKPLRSAGETES
jgi:hypothetical protein